MLEKLQLSAFQTASGAVLDIQLSYELFGQTVHSAPLVMVNHALTGNSHVAGPDGWWNSLIGPGLVVDTDKYTVLAFNIPGNGYDGFVIDNYKDFIAQDIARIFWWGADQLGIQEVFALIGGSLGGGIAWEMAALAPERIGHLVPVASDWKSTDWLMANCQIQEQFLLNSKQPVHDARMHAMLCYRTPESFKQRFGRSTNETLNVFNVESWLTHHGEKLQQRFQLSAYKLMNQLLRSIDITRGGRDPFVQFKDSKTHIHIIGVDSDLFFTAQENKDTFKQLAQANSRVTYGEINSLHGHDAFLMEYQQMERLLGDIFGTTKKLDKITVLKFGGKSLANGAGLDRVLAIIQEKAQARIPFTAVLSARGKATDQLESLLASAASGHPTQSAFDSFKLEQEQPLPQGFLAEEFTAIQQILDGVRLIGDYSLKTKDQLLAYGELMAVKAVVYLLQQRGVPAQAIDARTLIKTNNVYGNAQVIERISRQNVEAAFAALPPDTVAIFTGFLASSLDNETTTLGRNGSNYSAALLANFLDAKELQNFTHVDGIFTANPEWVYDAQKIEQLSYSEANELANFGAQVLHAKTIIPLIEKNIPLRILNTFNPHSDGTLISAAQSAQGIKSLSVIESVTLINLEGRGLLGKVGVDARIFKALGDAGVSVSIISQGSSERGIGLVVAHQDATKAIIALEREFEHDFYAQDINSISGVDQVSVLSIIGQDLSTFHKPYNALIKNGVIPMLFNNTVTGKNVSLVLKKQDLHKALNVVHGEIFGQAKKINLAVFGVGNVGGTLVDQIIQAAQKIEERKGIKLQLFALANSQKMLFNAQGLQGDWRKTLEEQGVPYDLEALCAYAQSHHLENLILVDNTADARFVKNYPKMIAEGFDLVSSNKIANTLEFDFYTELRSVLKQHQKQYLYETNVGAGLPLIDTIKLLHLSGENITKIRGVFSGSLSYIFNHFSIEDRPFSEVVREALEKGYTEPDPREDLSGNDVGRKLLILARELDLANEFSDISIENLIPLDLQQVDKQTFLSRLTELDQAFQSIKDQQKPGHVLRYLGQVAGDLQQTKGELSVSLVSVPQESTLGQMKGSDSLIEIFTESYGDQPLVIQGAGAGAAVTARGVFGDILRIADR